MSDVPVVDPVQKAASPAEVVTRFRQEWLAARLRESEKLLRRAVKMLNRVGWEKGETDQQWLTAAQHYLTCRKLEDDYERSQRSPIVVAPPSGSDNASMEHPE